MMDVYGRIDRVVMLNDCGRKKPVRLSSRPTKRVPVELPFSFVMGPEHLSKMSTCECLSDVLSNVLCLEAGNIAERLELIKQGKLDHVLMTFTSNNVPVKLAHVNGIYELLCGQYPDVSQRFGQLLLHLQNLSGSDRFQHRLELFAAYWDDWYDMSNYTWLGVHSKKCPARNANDNDGNNCTCQTYTLDQYCHEFDHLCNEHCVDDIWEYDTIHDPQLFNFLVITRKLMYVVFGCNKYYGFDGYTYDKEGNPVGKEYLAVNMEFGNKQSGGDNDDDHQCQECEIVKSVFLSEMDKFKLDLLE